MLREALTDVLSGETLARGRARDVFALAIAPDTDPVLLGGFLAALAARGETAAEIAGAVDALRADMRPFEHDHDGAIDTAGTGGDATGTFNISTAAALVAAAAGATVIKHGNRKISSSCGSADLLAAAGVPLDLSPDAARAVLDEVGITFLMAPLYHPALKQAAPVRASLGVRTVLNFLGPLLNPGRVRRQVVGVGVADKAPILADVLRELEHERAYVVHGHGGADELTLSGPNATFAVGDVEPHDFDADGLGLRRAPVDELAGGDAAANLWLLHDVVEGRAGPLADVVVLNAAAALTVAGIATDAADGVGRAREALARGDAARTLRAWTTTARRLQGTLP